MCRTDYNFDMARAKGRRSWTHWAVLLACAVPAVQRPSNSHAESPTVDALVIRRSPATGRATFVTARDGQAIWTPGGMTAAADRPMSFLRRFFFTPYLGPIRSNVVSRSLTGRLQSLLPPRFRTTRSKPRRCFAWTYVSQSRFLSVPRYLSD